MLHRSLSKRTIGFTLVELLVVVAIIALLLAILLPALNGARELAMRTRCLTNHRALAVGVNTYASEHNGWLPWSNFDNGNLSGRDPAGWLYDLNQSEDSLWDLDDEDRQEMRRTGSLFVYINGEDTYRCPLDEGPDLGWNGWNVHPMTSYQMNGAVSAFGRLRGEFTQHRIGWPSFPIHRMRSRAILFWEVENLASRAGLRNQDIVWWWNDGSNNPNETVTRRHRDGATVSSLDGSTEYLDFEAFQRESERKPGRLWATPDTDTGEGRDD